MRQEKESLEPRIGDYQNKKSNLEWIRDGLPDFLEVGVKVTQAPHKMTTQEKKNFLGCVFGFRELKSVRMGNYQGKSI